MPAPHNLPLSELLYEALDQPFGLLVRCNNVPGLMQRLYSIRREDPDLEPLALSQSKVDPNHLLIINKAGSGLTSKG